MTHAYSEKKKFQVLLPGVEPTTFRLPVRMLSATELCARGHTPLNFAWGCTTRFSKP